jgi:hypothetical protein
LLRVENALLPDCRLDIEPLDKIKTYYTNMINGNYNLPLTSKYSPQHPVLKDSSLRIMDQVSHPNKIMSNIIVLYVLK